MYNLVLIYVKRVWNYFKLKKFILLNKNTIVKAHDLVDKVNGHTICFRLQFVYYFIN